MEGAWFQDATRGALVSLNMPQYCGAHTLGTWGAGVCTTARKGSAGASLETDSIQSMVSLARRSV